MGSFPIRVLGLITLVLAIAIPSCQAVFPRTNTINAPQQLNPGSFGGSGR